MRKHTTAVDISLAAASVVDVKSIKMRPLFCHYGSAAIRKFECVQCARSGRRYFQLVDIQILLLIEDYLHAFKMSSSEECGTANKL